MSWTDERVETLKRMWAEGQSASQIAKERGGVPRNAVIGKGHRLGLSNRAEDEAAPATVLVTHHVEEVPPGFTHALLLSEGAVVSAGPLEETLTSERLSEAFGTALKVTRTDGRYTAVAA